MYILLFSFVTDSKCEKYWFWKKKKVRKSWSQFKTNKQKKNPYSYLVYRAALVNTTIFIFIHNVKFLKRVSGWQLHEAHISLSRKSSCRPHQRYSSLQFPTVHVAKSPQSFSLHTWTSLQSAELRSAGGLPRPEPRSPCDTTRLSFPRLERLLAITQPFALNNFALRH